MMSISMIAPAFAANPWKDLYSCENDSIEGTYEWVKYNDCPNVSIENLVTCDTKRGTEGHMEFKDLNPYDGEFQDEEEQTRCHKNSFWNDSISFVVPVV